jgi:hypothetical protein
MSPIRIVIGLLIAGLFLAGEIVAFWCFALPEKWIPIALLAFVALSGGLLMEIQTRKALRRYWERACTGIRWRRRFPDAPKTEIRDFLDIFIEAFGFRQKRRLCFAPDDRVMDVYHTLYPASGTPDGMELEDFVRSLQKRYGVDILSLWREDITLGELYERTRPHVV